MKRSEINAIIVNAKALLEANNIRLPPFGYWTPGEWATKGAECAEIRDCMLGWDVTDFASDDYEHTGLALFTVRNGHKLIEAHQHKTYCEKLLFVGEDQITPFHYHLDKEEDISNACGGELIIKLNNKAEDNRLADTEVTVTMDGVKHLMPGGSEIVLKPGESITLPPLLYHEFRAKPGKGPIISREVSKVNDDNSDNFFLQELPRFPEIEEDEAPIHLLCTEYGAGAGAYN